MFLSPSECLIFFHIFIPLGSIRNTFCISLLAENVTVHSPQLLNYRLNSMKQAKTPENGLKFFIKTKRFAFFRQSGESSKWQRSLSSAVKGRVSPLININFINTIDAPLFFEK